MDDPRAIIKGDVTQKLYKKAAARALANIPLTVCAELIGAVCLGASAVQIYTFGFTAMSIFTLIISLMLICFTPILPKMQSDALYKQLCATQGIAYGQNLSCKAMLYDDRLVLLGENDAAEVEFKQLKSMSETDETISLVTKSRLLLVLPIDGIMGMSAQDASSLIRNGMKK